MLEKAVVRIDKLPTEIVNFVTKLINFFTMWIIQT